MQNSSAGGAEIGTELAQGAAQETLQGQQYYTNALNNFLNTRNSFFGGEGAEATNAAQGGLTAAQNTASNTLSLDQILAGQQQAQAGYEAQNPELQNTYNLQNTGAQNTLASNIFNTQAGEYGNQLGYLQGVYGTQGNIYGQQLQAKGGF
jgi:hypothetical protein